MFNSILITNIIFTYIILIIVTFIGAGLNRLIPSALNERTFFFLSPTFGIAYFILIASLFGKFFSANHNLIVPCSFIVSLFLACLFNKNNLQTLKHANQVGVFGLICAVPFFITLYQLGGYNAHNDSFTYLAQSNWLQTHAFNQFESIDTTTPASTQIYLYQYAGLRMGATYLLSYFQSILHVDWAYRIYPSIIMLALISCCLSIGYPISCLMPNTHKNKICLTLILPALTLNGLTFGSQYGFLAQTYGIALNSAFLFLFGRSIRYLGIKEVGVKELIKFAFILSLLLAMSFVAYSEMACIVLIPLIICLCLELIHSKFRKQLIYFSSINLLLVLLLINLELPRIIHSLLIQANAIVGTPINWPLHGFFFHMIGVHPGAWANQELQWSMHLSSLSNLLLSITLSIVTCIGFFLIYKYKKILKPTLDELLPSFFFLATIILGIIYFRYFHSNPFEVGKGQSWNQFKLSEWGFSSAAIFILLIINYLVEKYKKINLVLLAIILLFVFQYHYKSKDNEYFKNFYQSMRAEQYYLKIREEVLHGICKDTPSIYLNLHDFHLKHMLALYFFDKHLKSNWESDGYIVHYLNDKQKRPFPNKQDCILEMVNDPSPLSEGSEKKIGFLKISRLTKTPEIKDISTTSEYNQEWNEKENWYWVNKKITFHVDYLRPLLKNKTRINFQFASKEDLQLTINIKSKNKTLSTITLSTKKNHLELFEKTFAYASNEIKDIIIESNGIGQPLGPNDSRVATFILKNFSINGVD